MTPSCSSLSLYHKPRHYCKKMMVRKKRNLYYNTQVSFRDLSSVRSNDLIRWTLPTDIFLLIRCSSYRVSLNRYVQTTIIRLPYTIVLDTAPTKKFPAEICSMGAAIFRTLHNGGVNATFPVRSKLNVHHRSRFDTGHVYH